MIKFRKSVDIWLFLVFPLSFIALSCRGDLSDKGILHVVVENNKIQEEQDLSSHFSAFTIEVKGEEAARIPGKVRNFEYVDNTLFLIHTQPDNVITAVNSGGAIKWQLIANADPITSFTVLTAYHFDFEKKTINVFDEQEHRVYMYDFEGKHLGKQETPSLYINDLFLLPTEGRLFSITSIKNEFEQNNEKAALVSYIEGNNSTTPSQILLKHPFYDPRRVPFTDSHDFFTNGQGELFYHRDFDDTLFQIKSLALSPKLTFSFARNDTRKQVLTTPNDNPLIVSQFLNENIPYSNFAIPFAGYFLMSYTYHSKEYFTMIFLRDQQTIFNTENFRCNGKTFSGRLDYGSGTLLNQMYAGNYKQLNRQEHDNENFEDENLVYTILTPKW